MVTQDRPVAANPDGAAITALRAAFEVQRKASRTGPPPSLDQRREHLRALAGALIANRMAIRDAVRADFVVHPDSSTDLVEVLGPAGRAQYAAERLDEWARPEERWLDPAVFGTGKAHVAYQPKGVIGNIVPWNFPFDLSFGPLADMLAAGNRVIIKPSEYTPSCAGLIRDIVRSTFDREQVDVAVGGLDLAREFSTLRWDHLLYTGNPEVGKMVATAAAENLVPVTLELGGKSPAILAEDGVTEAAVENVLTAKLVKSGQMCISVDYVLVPRRQLRDFVTLAETHTRRHLRDYSGGAHYTGIISDRHLHRLLGMVEQARAAGAEVIQLDDDGVLDHRSRRMPLYLVVDPPAGLDLVREEIFGPILPVKPYDDLDEVIEFINAGERPLGVYVFTGDDAFADRVQHETTSGGFCRNACASHAAVPSLGFGGIGRSGHGRHHGIDGFREFSNAKGVFVRGEDDVIDAFGPPYDGRTDALLRSALPSAGASGEDR